MKKLIPLILLAFFLGCKTSDKVQQHGTGLIKDDPYKVGKIPTIMSEEFIESGFVKSGDNVMARGRADKIAPSVSILAPTSGSVVAGLVSVYVNAYDNVGVNYVKLYVDGTEVSIRVSAPYTNQWNSVNFPNGSHILKVIAWDKAGNQSQPYSVTVTSNNQAGDVTPPTVSITAPVSGSTYARNLTVTVNVTATDNNRVDSVKFLIDSLRFAVSTVSPFTATFNTGNFSSGNHTLIVTAYDPSNNQASASIQFSIKADSTIPPQPLPASFRLATPTPGDQGGEGSCVPFAATYAARSIEQYYKTGSTAYNESTNILSPEFVYDMIMKGYSCSGGTSIMTCLEFMRTTGACLLARTPYLGSNGCGLVPTAAQIAEAANYKITGYSSVYSNDVVAVKTMLVNKRPLICGISIDNNFVNSYAGYIWNSFGTFFSNHALTIIGYDDSKNAWLIQNSWGATWGGGSGTIWVDYDFFKTISWQLIVLNTN